MISHVHCWVSQTGIAALVLLCGSTSAIAQSFVARVNGGDRFAVVLSRDAANLLTVEVRSNGGDECGRDFYFRGVLLPDASRLSGSVAGTMKRCTNEELKNKCESLGRPIGDNYAKTVTGKFKNEAYGLIVTLIYEAEKWQKNECKYEKSENGTDTVLISKPSTGGSRGTTYDDLIRAVIFSPPNHPLNPANSR